MAGADLSYGELVLSALGTRDSQMALWCEGTAVSYEGMSHTISRLIQALKSMGLDKGHAVAILSPNRPEYFMVTVACAVLGIRYTPLHPMGSLEDHLFIVEDARIDALVFDATDFSERCAQISESSPGLRWILSLGATEHGNDLLAMADSFSPAAIVNMATADDVLAIAYTGGTTGRPKGAVLSHGSIVRAIQLILDGWQWPDEVRILLTTPISHAAGAMIVPTLLKGGSVYLKRKFQPAVLLGDVERYKITTLFLVPSMIYMLLDELPKASYDLSSLKLLLYGAAPMSRARLRQGIDNFGPIFMQIYGQVESSVAVCALRKEDHLNPDRLLSCGKPLTPENFRILNSEAAEPRELAAGEIGEICLRGPTIMDSYWQRGEESAATLRDGWLHTGDLARFDSDGFVYIVDRKKDMIVSGGFNVFPREIEDVLMEHPAVGLVAVIGIPHAKWGEAVHCLIVVKGRERPSEQELIDLVKTRKGLVYAPKSIEFVESLPLTAIGKVDKKAVRSKYWQGQDRLVG